MLRNADAPWSQTALGLISFFEASILPLPPSAFLLFMVALSEKRRWIRLAFITTVTSVLGGLFGYYIGDVLYDSLGTWIIERYDLAEDIDKIGEQFKEHAFWSLFIAAFSPIPYKAFTVGAGFFDISLKTFIIASTLGRGLRYFVVAYLAKLFGVQVAKSAFRYAMGVTVVAVILMIAFAMFV